MLKVSDAAGAFAALQLIVLYSGVMILGIRTQRESVPENPIDGMKKSSMVMLTGTKEVLAEQTKENGSSRQQMQNQQPENQDMPETEKDTAAETAETKTSLMIEINTYNINILLIVYIG